MTLTLDIHHQQGDFRLSAVLEAGPGVLALFGASGSGKTTLINILAGLVRPTRARIVLGGTVLTDTAAGIHVPPYKRRIGYVFQEGRLFPHLNVRQNLVFGRWFAGAETGPHARFAQVTGLLGLEALLQRPVRNLSGGEKQRVAIGRALLAEPRLLIMDEPLAGLDQPRKEEILPYLERLRSEAKMPMVYVSHSVAEVARLATTVAVLDAGRLAAFGPVGAVLQHSEQLPLSERGEASSIIEATPDPAASAPGLTLLRSAGNLWQVPAQELRPGAKLRLRVRARDVMVALSPPADISALNILPGRIAELRPGGAGATDVLIDCTGDKLVARLTDISAARLKLAPGLAVYVIVKAVALERE
jgi:molybdate transport system ATP-binding protein